MIALWILLGFIVYCAIGLLILLWCVKIDTSGWGGLMLEPPFSIFFILTYPLFFIRWLCMWIIGKA